MKKHLCNEIWNVKPYKSRQVLYLLQLKDGQDAILQAAVETHRRLVNGDSQYIHSGLKNGSVDLSLLKKESTYRDVYKSCNANLKRHRNELIFNARSSRSASWRAARFYYGYEKRNNKLSRKPAYLRANKAMYVEDGVFSDLTNVSKIEGRYGIGSMRILVPGLKEKSKDKAVDSLTGRDQNSIIVDYKVPKGMLANKQFISKLSGNLRVNCGQWMFSARGKVPFTWLYSPLGYFAFDINKSRKNFLYLSEKLMYQGKLVDSIPHTQEMRDYIAELVILNKKIKSKEMRSGKRRLLRRRVQRVHQILEDLCRPICQILIDHVKTNNLLLCIDECSPGAGSGCFCQDKIRILLRTMAEDLRIPFVLVPSHHTSKCCHICMTECDRPQNEKVVCPNCGDIMAHYNAAQNIKNWGIRIWQDGTAAFLSWKKNNFKRTTKAKLTP